MGNFELSIIPEKMAMTTKKYYLPKIFEISPHPDPGISISPFEL